MSKIVTKKNIPEGGDIVDDVKYNKDRTLGCVIFDSGKKVFFDVNPAEFGKKPKKVQTESVSRSPKQVNAMDKNTPQDQEYQKNAMITLARMRGIPLEQIQEEMASNIDVGAATMLSSQPTEAMEDFEEQKQRILESSESRSKRLSEEYSRAHGGRLENSFGGSNTISQETI